MIYKMNEKLKLHIKISTKDKKNDLTSRVNCTIKKQDLNLHKSIKNNVKMSINKNYLPVLKQI
jgi:hypothetical protein